jgi:hypothetical protein
MTDPSNVAPGSIQKRTRGYLPHWERDGGAYFVTFRLADSLPRTILEQIIERRSALEYAARAGRELLPVERVNAAQMSSARIESFLDRGTGECHLARLEIATLVKSALKHHEGERYCLFLVRHAEPCACGVRPSNREESPFCGAFVDLSLDDMRTRC